MSNTNTGGPAFPHTEANGANSGDVGMTLRDYFAAKALQGFLADPKPFYDNGEGLPKAYATEAYIYADAMLKAREA
jgi:hypothetical protein